MKAVDGVSIRKALHMENGYQEAMARDLFALGCKLRADGHTEAGDKAVWCALQGAAGVPLEAQLKICRSLPGNEAAYAEAARAHAELTRYLESELAGFER